MIIKNINIRLISLVHFFLYHNTVYSVYIVYQEAGRGKIYIEFKKGEENAEKKEKQRRNWKKKRE